MFITFISKLLSGFLYIISKYLINKEEIPYILTETRNMRLYHLNVNAINKCKILLYIIIIAVLEVLVKIENMLFSKIKNLIEIKLGFIIFIPILSYIILKTKYYRHHFVSTTIGFFGFSFIILPIFFPKKGSVPYWVQIIHFFISFPISLSIIIIKYMFIHYFIEPFKFLFIDGIF